MIFKSRETIFKELNEIINKQHAEIQMLKGTIIVKDKEIDFYNQRGEKYFTGLDNNERRITEMFNLAKEILEKSVNASTRRLDEPKSN